MIYDEMETTGNLETSDPMINRIYKNAYWGIRGNYRGMPTDCPQRDERMGWTGDIAVFAPTAYFNFDLSRFAEKWLLDVKAEQLPSGGIPNTVPAQGYGFPATMPTWRSTGGETPAFSFRGHSIRHAGIYRF